MPVDLATDARVARLLDVASIGLVGALAAWTALVPGGGDGRSTPVLLLLAALVAAVAVGRRLAPSPGLVPRAVATAIAGALFLTYPGLLGAGGAPTGYANSNATLAGVGAIAAAAATRRAPKGRPRQAWTALSGALALATLLTRSVAGIGVLLFVAALWLVAAQVRWPPLVAGGGVVAVALALALTIGAALDDQAPLADTDAVRVELWAAAVDLAGEEPVRGLGAGAFEERNPITDDDDLRWVHQEYLELAVELGGVGLALTLALGLGVLARLALAGTQAEPAAAALVAVALHGTVDHVWHTPALLVLVALLVGAGTGPRAVPHACRPPSVAEEAAQWARTAIAGDRTEA